MGVLETLTHYSKNLLQRCCRALRYLLPLQGDKVLLYRKDTLFAAKNISTSAAFVSVALFVTPKLEVYPKS